MIALTEFFAMHGSLDDLPKNELINQLGARYRDVRRTLQPQYVRVWSELLAGHASIGLGAVGMVAAQAILGPFAALAVPVGALTIGYGIAYVYLFMHEAGHYNLAADKGMNDLLANVFIGSLVGQDVRAYRPLHWEHHRSLGTPEDTERSYFDPLNLRFVVESLTGVRLAKVILGRARDLHKKRGGGGSAGDRHQDDEGQIPSLLNGPLLLALSLHGALLGGAFLTGQWALVGAWSVGVVAVFPFFAGLRQVLEHRSADVAPDVDFTKVAHGEVNRMFGDSWLARTFGGAGFNRHLLHHWDPQVPYTRLKELEAFLMGTAAAPFLKAAQTTYLNAFLTLMRAGSRHA